MTDKQIILHLEGKFEETKELATTALEKGLNSFFSNDSDIIDGVKKLGNVSTFSSEVPTSDMEVIDGWNSEKMDNLINENKRFSIILNVTSKEDENKILAASEKGAEVVFVNTPNWKVIPIENLISYMHKLETKLFSVVHNAEDAKLMFETLEIGVDGVLIAPKNIEEIFDLAKTLVSTKGKLDLSVAKVVEIKEVGMGDRVCVDTCSILDIGEGLLVGSQSNFQFLVHGETIQAEFCDPRPFRVNAGPVHAYVSLPSGKTQYLSELHVGDKVLIVNAAGNTRSAIVGRAKIERRPLILVKAEYNGIVGKTLLQNAETIRLVSPDGSAISVSDLQVGDEVIVYTEKGGRHFGVSVDEFVLEQ
ncbi:3-dehydroquinate synthase II [Candidatus Borrarchaeum sp.]|uniref:3-dehydroquinate synthase II n=1 Tax=Candidatus Borrarchaeum sp. TaxID=2846742 RepID=UPI00257B593F|nr:3-dehydroquinate synthase II [Candidatus Borrarchaeum sp.]